VAATDGRYLEKVLNDGGPKKFGDLSWPKEL
jgi:hypothetical protein